MKSNIYQFSVNLGTLQSQNQQEDSLWLLMRDIFPYLKLKSITSTIQVVTLLPFLVQLSHSALLPNQTTYSYNLFTEICGFLAKSMIFLRLASEYEYRLGFKYFLVILITVGVLHILGSMIVGVSIQQLFSSHLSLLSIYVLSILDLNKLKESQLIQFQQEEKVENYDLLDLNDTIVKLKNRDNHFTYDSYTNKEFYTHHFSSHPSQKSTHKKHTKGVIKKSNTFSQIIDSSLAASETSSLQTKVYKLIVFNFIVFGHCFFDQFAMFLLGEAAIYLLISTRLIKRLVERLCVCIS